MKKIITAVLLAVGLVIGAPVVAFASPAVSTYVHGYVGALGSPDKVAGADVQVTCNGQTKITNTGVDGAYEVSFLYADCPVGSHVEVVASMISQGLSGRNVEGSGQVNNNNGSGDAEVFVLMHTDTEVRGDVRDAHGNNAGGAQVKVTCDGHTISTLADGNGHYQVTFRAADCQIGGDWAEAVATKSGFTGSGSGPVLDFGNGIATIDTIHLTAPISVPEMGLATGFGALTLAGGAFVYIRRNRRAYHS